MLRMIFSFVFLLFSSFSFASSYFVVGDMQKIHLAGQTYLFQMIPDFEQKIEKVWGMVNKLLPVESQKIVLPVILFEEFNQNLLNDEWISFQEKWDREISTNHEKPFNDKHLPAYTYLGSNVIQIRPSFFKEDLRQIRQSSFKSVSGKGFYTLGHEFFHLILDQLGVDGKLHHCLMIRQIDSDMLALSHLLKDSLIKEGTGSFLLFKQIVMEQGFQPCQKLTSAQLEEIDNFLSNLRR